MQRDPPQQQGIQKAHDVGSDSINTSTRDTIKLHAVITNSSYLFKIQINFVPASQVRFQRLGRHITKTQATWHRVYRTSVKSACLILSAGYETRYYKHLVWVLKGKTISNFPGVSQNVISAENTDIVFHQNLTGSKVETCI
jgi:hypothetical protein